MPFKDFIVAKSFLVSILGLETCGKLGLISRTTVNTVKQLQNKYEILNKYKDVFSGVGCFRNLYSIKSNIKTTI